MTKRDYPYYPPKLISKINKTLKSGKVNYWTGNEGILFEKEFSNYVGNKYSIAVSNGSIALEIALKALNLKKKDEIIVTPRSFVISASCVINLGLKPVFADVDLNGNLSIEGIKKCYNKKVKAIIVVHLNGLPCNLNPIINFTKKNKIKLIEDCSQAHGAKYKNKSVGSFGDISTWSFCQDKIISTGGEGGMITTNNEEIYKKIWSFKDHGKSFTKMKEKNNKSGYRYIHDNLGSNFRLTEMQSAIGRIQIKKLDLWTQKRRENALFLQNSLSQCKLIRIPLPGKEIIHAWYKFNCFINKEFLKEDWSRDKIIKAINEKGYPAFQGGCSELYLEKCFNKKSTNPFNNLLVAKELGETNLTFLVHPTINKIVMSNYALNIREVLNLACK